MRAVKGPGRGVGRAMILCQNTVEKTALGKIQKLWNAPSNHAELV